MIKYSTAASFLLTCCLLGPANAGTEDRDNHASAVSGWADYLTAAQVRALVASGKRLVDIEVMLLPSGPRFTVSWVKNSGAFAKKSWWTYAATAGGLTTLINLRKARIVDIEVYQTAMGPRFAAILEENTGPNSKGWSWYNGVSYSFLLQQASKYNQRIVDMEGYANGRNTVYAAVLLSNTGADKKKNYKYLGISANQLATYMRLTKARLWDVDMVGPDRFNALTVESKGEATWYYFARTASQVNALLAQHGARIIDVERHLTIVGPRFDIVLVNSVNALSRRVGDLMMSKSDGSVGASLQKVTSTGSFTLGAVNAETKFEPAGTMAAVPLMRAALDVRDKIRTPSTPVQIHFKTTILNKCPSSTTAFSVPLAVAMERMMRQGKYEYARTFTNIYGLANLNAMVATLKMKDTRLNHHLGCQSPANTTTLADLGRLYETVVRNQLGTARSLFLSSHNRDIVTYYASGYLKKVMDQEAAKVGLTASQAAYFANTTVMAGKGGHYNSGNKYQRSWFGYVQLPCFSNSGIEFVHFTTGAFVNNATNVTKAVDAAATGAAEILREEINKCMRTLKNHTFGHHQQFGLGCSGKLLTSYAHYVSGKPHIGNLVSYSAKATRTSNSAAMLFIGASNSSWLGTPLPMELGFMGAPKCYAHISLDTGIAMMTQAGQVSLKVKIPVDKSLIGQTFFTQYWVADPGANAAGLTTSNGVRTFIGGQK